MKDNQALSKTIFSTAPFAEESQLNWPVIRHFLRKYAAVIAGVFVLTIVSTYATLSLLTELYETEAQMLVKMGRENLDPPAVSRNMPLTTGLRREELLSEVAMLKSPDLVASVVDEMGVEAFRVVRVPPPDLVGRIKFEVKRLARGVKQTYEDALIAVDLKKRLNERERVIDGLLSDLAIDPVKDSDVISIKLRMPNPTLAAEVESRMIAAYMKRRIGVRKTDGVQEFLDEMAQQRHSELMSAETKRQSFKKRTGVVSPSEQRTLLLTQLRGLSEAHARTVGEMEAAQQQLAASKGLLERTPQYHKLSQQTTPNPLVQTLKERILTLETERNKALSRYQPESQVVRDLDEEMQRVRALLNKEDATQIGAVTEQLNPTRQLLEQRVHQESIRAEGLRASSAAEEREIAQVQAQIRAIDSADGALTDLERDRNLAEQNYLTIMKRKLDSDVSSQLDKERISNVSVLMPPASSLQPVYPRKLFIFYISLGAGLVLGLALALMLHYFDDRLDRPEDVEALIGAPCLGSVRQSA